MLDWISRLAAITNGPRRSRTNHVTNRCTPVVRHVEISAVFHFHHSRDGCVFAAAAPVFWVTPQYKFAYASSQIRRATCWYVLCNACLRLASRERCILRHFMSAQFLFCWRAVVVCKTTFSNVALFGAYATSDSAGSIVTSYTGQNRVTGSRSNFALRIVIMRDCRPRAMPRAGCYQRCRNQQTVSVLANLLVHAGGPRQLYLLFYACLSVTLQVSVAAHWRPSYHCLTHPALCIMLRIVANKALE